MYLAMKLFDFRQIIQPLFFFIILCSAILSIAVLKLLISLPTKKVKSVATIKCLTL